VTTNKVHDVNVAKYLYKPLLVSAILLMKNSTHSEGRWAEIWP